MSVLRILFKLYFSDMYTKLENNIFSNYFQSDQDREIREILELLLGHRF